MPGGENMPVFTISSTAITANVEKDSAAQTVPSGLTQVQVQLTDNKGSTKPIPGGGSTWALFVTALGSTANPQITTDRNHGLTAGQQVLLGGLLDANGNDVTLGGVDINAVWTIRSIVNSRNFTITAAAPDVAYSTSLSNGWVASLAHNVKIWGVQQSFDGGATWNWGPVWQGDATNQALWNPIGVLAGDGSLPMVAISGSQLTVGSSVRLGILTDTNISLGAVITTVP